ncbi:cytochrome c biogenesis CcdA family protein [Jatrophihabitans sp. DSM 45814]
MASSPLAADTLVSTVNSGPLIAAIGVSLVVGVIGFLSPCVLPLVPGYLSYVAGLSGSEAAAAGSTAAGGGSTRVLVRQRRMIAGALLFVLGFTTVFVAAGALFGSLGSQMAVHHVALERTFGVITILMGLVFVGKIPFMQRELKVHRLPQSGLIGAPLLGLTFGLAWTPCLTPTLSAVLGLATSQATAGRGMVLSAAYCLGLGVPFILVAMGIGWVTGTLTVLRRHAALVSRIGGGVLIVFGILLLTGTWDDWILRLNAAFAGKFIGSGL